MRPFRFKAAGALDLRKRLEDDARLMLTRAQNAAALADQKLADARTARDHARAQFTAAQHQGAEGWRIRWHQSWIVRQSREADACQRHAALAHGIVAKATAVLHEAHKKRRVLERLRDRLAARHVRAMEREELAHMNELATVRYQIARAEQEEHT